MTRLDKYLACQPPREGFPLVVRLEDPTTTGLNNSFGISSFYYEGVSWRRSLPQSKYDRGSNDEHQKDKPSTR